MCIFKKLTEKMNTIHENVLEVNRLVSEHNASMKQEINEIKHELTDVNSKLKKI